MSNLKNYLNGTIDVATVDLDPATPGIQTTWIVVGQGTYTVTALGVVTFTAVANFNGVATPVNYTVNDNNGAVSTIATIAIIVTAVNDPLVANDDTNACVPSTAGATPINALTVNDVDGTISTYTVLSLPNNGVLTLAGTPVTQGQVLTPAQVLILTYDPSGTFVGNDTFTFTATDNSGVVDATPATITIVMLRSSISLIKTATAVDENKDGFVNVGETIRYNFTITNTGNVPLTNIFITDVLPGLVLTGSPISLQPGQVDSSTFVGIYKITQADANNEEVTNQATVFGTPPLGPVVKDLSDSSSNLSDRATVLGVKNCVVEVSNAVSPNNDDKNDYFHIEGLDCFTTNTVKIYNRWGVLVFETERYNNLTNRFEGLSKGRTTISQSEGLPDGTYFYVLEYIDFSGNGINKAGYLYLTK